MHVEIKPRNRIQQVNSFIHAHAEKEDKGVESNRKGPALDFHEWKRNENSFWSTRDRSQDKLKALPAQEGLKEV